MMFFALLGLGGCSKKDSAKIIEVKLTQESYAFVLKEGNVSLQNSFNEFLEEIKDDGTFNKIIAWNGEGFFNACTRSKYSRCRNKSIYN